MKWKSFLKSFQSYLKYGDDDTKFVINLDDLWKWVGFSKKDKAKDLLIKHFETLKRQEIAIFEE